MFGQRTQRGGRNVEGESWLRDSKQWGGWGEEGYGGGMGEGVDVGPSRMGEFTPKMGPSPLEIM